MKYAALIAGLLLLAGCVARAPRDESETVEVQTKRTAPPSLVELLPEGHHAGAVVEVNGASIVAIVAEDAPTETPYLVLDEAMKAGVCTIKETGSVDENGQQVDGDVNTLLVSNTGSSPVFLMAGDLVLGGKQDRVLAESVVVDPGTKDMRIPVFCVEHGRWTVQMTDGEAAAKGHFANESASGQVDMSVKSLALQTQDQGTVWDGVAKSNSALGVGAVTGTFRATYDDERTRKRLDDAFVRTEELLENGVVGFAVVHDTEVAAFDLFDSAGLARKVSEKLLRSYILTAIANGYELTLAQKIQRRAVTLNAQDSTIDALAESMSQQLGITVSAPEGVEERVNVNLQGVDGLTAVARVAEAANLTAVERDGTVAFVQRDRVVFMSQEGNTGPSLTLAGLPALGDIPRLGEFFTHQGRVSQPDSHQPTTPNGRTSNSRTFNRSGFEYICEDKKTGRKVQTSYMRR